MEYIDIKKLIDVIRRETKKHANTKERVSRVLDELLDFTKNNYQLIGNYVLQEDLNNYLNSKLNVDGSNIENLEEWKVILNYYDKTETYSQTEINNFLSGKQNSIGYIPENSANKSDSYTASSSTTYASTKALVDGLDTKLDKGTYTGTAQDLKNEIDGKANASHTHNISDVTNLQTALDSKEDISNKQNNLNADATNTKYPTVTAVNDGLATKQKLLSSFDESILIETDGNIEGNISLFEEYFEQQVCELNFIPTQTIGVYQDGIKLSNSEYEIILPKKIKIKEYVDENIQIEYTHLKS